MWQLDLKHYMFPSIHIDGNHDFDVHNKERDCSVEVSMWHKLDVEDNELAIGLTLSKSANADEVPYDIDVSVMGFFNVTLHDSAFDSKRELSIAIVNGAQILYGVVRDTIHTLTSKGPWDALIISTQYFSAAQIYDELDNEETMTLENNR